MPVGIFTPEGREPLAELILFHETVYSLCRSAYWPSNAWVQMAILNRDIPYRDGLRVRPFLARDGETILARAVAVIDQGYIDHWKERLGHIIMFEALPNSQEATVQLMNAVCDWLREQGMLIARAGLGLTESPFLIDNYESLPPCPSRQNPAYYHSLLKEAGFVGEKGLVDYKIAVSSQLREHWQEYLGAAVKNGLEIVPLSAIPAGRRVAEFCDTLNDALRSHWGLAPFTPGRLAHILELMEPASGLDLSTIGYYKGQPVAASLAMEDLSRGATLASGRVLDDSEKLNGFFVLGMRNNVRGRGFGLGMTAHLFLETYRRSKPKYLSAPVVLDENSQCRSMIKSLGGFVCSNSLVYKRSL